MRTTCARKTHNLTLGSNKVKNQHLTRDILHESATMVTGQPVLPSLSCPACPTATAESAKTLTGLVTVNNANKIATRLVCDTLRVESVRANRIEGAPMPRHQITPALR